MIVQVKINGRLYKVDIQDINSRPIIAVVEGETYEIWPEDGQPESTRQNTLKEPLGRTTIAVQPPDSPAHVRTDSQSAERFVTAPLPGTIISIQVAVGDSVVAGQELLIIEAMKMKNSIRAARNGVIGKILVSTGQTVKHQDVLMEYPEET